VKNIILAAIAALTIGAAPALAADLPAAVYKAPVQAVVAPNWTGFYVNGGGGYGMWDADTTTRNTITGFCALCTTTRQGGKGYFGTIGGGFDYQFTSNIVAGVLADYDFSSLKGDIQDQGPFSVARIKQDSAWAAGGRAGWLITPALMSYVTGGYAHADFTGAQAFNNGAGGVPFAPTQTYQKSSYSGYFLGGGAEWKLDSVMPSFMGTGWFWRNEYRVANYGTKTIVACNGTTGLCGTPGGFNGIRFDPVVQTFRTELVWKFGSWR
jgi:outer membrane immunogenic protein